MIKISEDILRVLAGSKDKWTSNREELEQPANQPGANIDQRSETGNSASVNMEHGNQS